MATEVILPRVDMDMTEGTIAFWYVKNGDPVTKGQVLFDIETDKATMEVDAPVAGIFDGLRGEIGVPIPVGQVVGWIRAEGESLPDAEAPSVETSPVAPTAAVPERAAAEATAAPRAGGSALLRATPLARSLARDRGLALDTVSGSGPGGRIVAADLPAGDDTARTIGYVHLQWQQPGEAVPLVLLHGFGADQGGWRPLVQQLGPGTPVIGIDLPGHGKSDPLGVERFDDLARAVLHRLNQEGVDRFHLLGHSLGGGTAIAVAARAGDRLRSLTLLAPAGLGPELNGAFIDGLLAGADEAALAKTLALLFHDPAALSGSFVATAAQQLAAPGRREALAAIAAVLMPSGVQAATPAQQVLGGLRMPVKVVWGRADRIIPVAHALGLPGRVGLHLLDDVGHLPQIEAASLVAELVQQQLRAAQTA